MTLLQTVTESKKQYETVRDIQQLYGTETDSERQPATTGDS